MSLIRHRWVRTSLNMNMAQILKKLKWKKVKETVFFWNFNWSQKVHAIRLTIAGIMIFWEFVLLWKSCCYPKIENAESAENAENAESKFHTFRAFRVFRDFRVFDIPVEGVNIPRRITSATQVNCLKVLDVFFLDHTLIIRREMIMRFTFHTRGPCPDCCHFSFFFFHSPSFRGTHKGAIIQNMNVYSNTKTRQIKIK